MNSIPRRPQAPLLDLRNVRVMRGDVTGRGMAGGGMATGAKIVLDDLNLRVRADEHVAVLGPNGCGKSTLIKTITRECYPMVRKGSSMTILGQKSWNIFELRSLLGIVSNDLMSSCTGDASGLDVVLVAVLAVWAFRAFARGHAVRTAAALSGDGNYKLTFRLKLENYASVDERHWSFITDLGLGIS